MVDAVPLSAVTPNDVRQWKTDCLNKAKRDETLRRRYTITINSTLRQARSLFGERNIIKHLPEIPRPHLFEGVEFEPRVDTKFYGAGIDAPSLFRRALKDLGTDRKEELKAFLLAISLGLRRREADLLEWNSFDFTNFTVQIQPTEYYALKTRESAATMSLDPEIMAMFKGWHAQRSGRFVIESVNPPRPDILYQHYRCDQVFNSLVDWLRLQGVTGNKPFHVLRKLFGSLVVEKYGVFAASSALRHTSIEITNSFYLDRTIRTTSGLGCILSGADVTPLPVQPETAKKSRETLRVA